MMSIELKNRLKIRGSNSYQMRPKLLRLIRMNRLQLAVLKIHYASTLEDEDAVENSVARTFENLPTSMFKILLSHRPEQFEIYVDNQVDVTFSGHAHGGQFRFPGIGGLLSPWTRVVSEINIRCT